MRAARLGMPKRVSVDAYARLDRFLKEADLVLDDGAANALLDAINQGKKPKAGTLNELRYPWAT